MTSLTLDSSVSCDLDIHATCFFSCHVVFCDADKLLFYMALWTAQLLTWKANHNEQSRYPRAENRQQNTELSQIRKVQTMTYVFRQGAWICRNSILDYRLTVPARTSRLRRLSGRHISTHQGWINKPGPSRSKSSLVPSPYYAKSEKGSGQKGRTLVSPRNIIKRLRVRVH